MADEKTPVEQKSRRSRAPAKRTRAKAPTALPTDGAAKAPPRTRRRRAAPMPETAVASLNPEIAAEEHLEVARVEEEAPAVHETFRPTPAGWLARRATLTAVILLLLMTPLMVSQSQDGWIALGLIYVIVGFSINVLMGYAGQISLGHQAFVGVGALTSAIIVTKAHMPFPAALLIAGATGAASAVILGFVALRLKGLYLALITLAYGSIAESSIFSIGALTGGGAGTDAPRPAGFVSNRGFAYLCFIILALVMAIDWRLVKSKAGRAILAIRENEQAASSFGVNVVAYKLFAFVISGAIAGIGGSLFAHLATTANGSDFDFTLALTFVLMVAVGGLGSRVGIFIGSAFFAIFPLALNSVHFPTCEGLHCSSWFKALMAWMGRLFHTTSVADMVPLIGALLLLLTLTLNPGGIAQQLRPFTDWFAGKRFTMKHSDQSIATGGAGVRP